MNTVYFDNSATTALSDAAKRAMTDAMEIYGNPSSLHPIGNEAHRLLEDARQKIAQTLGVRRPEPGELLFTACGTEADNLAIFGTAYAKPRRKGGRIISTDSEHPAVENCLRVLESQGFDVVRISTRGGMLDFDAYADALTDKTFLVTMMTVNNETGAVYDIGRAFSMAKAKNPDIVTHTDAVQGYLKCKMTPKSVRADLMTLSAHKIHGPKGVGCLYVSSDARRRRDLVPVMQGGGQEFSFRSGTENTVGIAGFAAAAFEGFSSLDRDLAKMVSLRDLAESLLAELPVTINRPLGTRAPHILNFILPNIKSETMLHALSLHGICVSAGSACSSHAQHPSSALLSFGVPADQIQSAIRVSFSSSNTEQEVRFFVSSLREEIEKLVKIQR